MSEPRSRWGAGVLPWAVLGGYVVLTLAYTAARFWASMQLQAQLRLAALVVGVLAVVVGILHRTVIEPRLRPQESGTVVRPQPAVPVARGFRDVVRLRVEGQQVVAVRANHREYPVRVRAVQVVERQGRPEAVVLIGEGGVRPLQLPWPEWFGADPASAERLLSLLAVPVERTDQRPREGSCERLYADELPPDVVRDPPFGVECGVVALTTLATLPMNWSLDGTARTTAHLLSLAAVGLPALALLATWLRSQHLRQHVRPAEPVAPGSRSSG